MNDLDNLRVPVWCPICDGPMKGSFSTRTYYDFGCCANCFIEFIEFREERWATGWRPSKEDLEAFKQKNGG